MVFAGTQLSSTIVTAACSAFVIVMAVNSVLNNAPGCRTIHIYSRTRSLVTQKHNEIRDAMGDLAHSSRRGWGGGGGGGGGLSIHAELFTLPVS